MTTMRLKNFRGTLTLGSLTNQGIAFAQVPHAPPIAVWSTT